MLYSLDKLMSETRRLASEYHLATSQVMPVTAELARYDAVRLLNWEPVPDPQKGVDALGRLDEALRQIQIKGRVIFNPNKIGQRVGALNFSGAWDLLVLVIYDALYAPQEIYALDRHVLESNGPDCSKNSLPKKGSLKKGPLSVQRFRKMGRLIWSAF